MIFPDVKGREGPATAPDWGSSSQGSPMPVRPASLRLGSALLAVIPITGLAVGPAAGGERRAEAPLALMALSAEVADWGRSAKDPLALIVAAEIRARIGTRSVDRAPQQTGEPTADVSAAADLTADGLLAEAVALSGRDATIAALAEDVKASATKGLVQGAGASRATVRPAGTDWYRRLRFEGSRYAEAYVELAGPGSVSVSVFDDAGNLVCRDPNPSSVAYCGWTPSATATFDVRVENRGTAAVPYRLFTN